MFTRDSKILSRGLTTPLTSVANAVGDVFKPITFNQLIKSLFANGEQGFAYDPNDLTTMFQDAAGTIPVTAAGQPVGMVLDKSKGLELGAEMAGVTGQWEAEPSWTKVGNVYTHVANTNIGGLFINKPIIIDKWFIFKVKINLRAGYISIYRNGTFYKEVYTVGASTHEIIMRGIDGISNTRLVDLYAATSFDGDVDISFTSLREVKGNHAYQHTSASRPILRQNAITGAYYLEFDGSDDFLVTNSIDFTSTDKVSLFAGVRKLSDEGQMIAELSEISNFNNGTFYLSAGDDSGIGYSSLGRGSASINISQIAHSFTYIAPDTAVLSVKHDISNSLSRIRRNGVIGADGLGYKGSGNFGNYPLYIGRRGGTSLAFNGHIYSLIGVGRLTTDAETKALEKLIAKNTGVTLSV